MSGIFGKLFLHNGRIPWLQFLVAFVVGVISSFAYVKWRKPQAILNALCPAQTCVPPPRGRAPAGGKAAPVGSPVRDRGAAAIDPQALQGGRKGAARYAQHPGDDDQSCNGDEMEDDFGEDVAVFPLPIYVAEGMMRHSQPTQAPITSIEEEEDDDAKEVTSQLETDGNR
jgi:hypothetical protein